MDEPRTRTSIPDQSDHHQNSITGIEGDSDIVMPTTMQTLPPEVLITILDQIDVDTEKQELRNLRRTCRTLANLAAPYLFRKVVPDFIYYHLKFWALLNWKLDA